MSAATTAGETANRNNVSGSLIPDMATQLAIERTRLGFERTTMAWVRTATSLITFGFSVYKFFQLGQEKTGALPRVIGPREFALSMISIGIVSLLVGTLQQWQGMKAIRKHYPEMHTPRSLAMLVGALISILGIVSLVEVILRR